MIEKTFLSSSVRFHNYKATEKEVKNAVDSGMNVFLCDDLKRISYDLTQWETEVVNRQGSFAKSDRTYIKTNIRLERPFFWQFIKSQRFDTLVIFGHEWAFDDYRERLEVILKTLFKNQIIFV